MDINPSLTRCDSLNLPYRYASIDAGVVVTNLERGTRRRRLFKRSGRSVACDLAWAPDGRTVYHSSEQLLAIDMRARARAVTSFGGRARYGVIWDLFCSPDGRTLLFAQHRPRPIRICSLDLRTNKKRVVHEGVWMFTCDWASNVILMSTSSTPAIWRMDLEGRDVRKLVDGVSASHMCIAPGGRRATYQDGTTIYELDLETGKNRPVASGFVSSLSPDGSTLAMMYGDHELRVQRIGAKSEVLVAVPDPEVPRRGSWARTPEWSADGRLLWFGVTQSTRDPEPRSPEFVRDMQRLEKRARRARKGRGRIDYAGSIEHVYWRFEHWYGVIDWQTRRIMLRDGYETQVAFAPS